MFRMSATWYLLIRDLLPLVFGRLRLSAKPQAARLFRCAFLPFLASQLDRGPQIDASFVQGTANDAAVQSVLSQMGDVVERRHASRGDDPNRDGGGQLGGGLDIGAFEHAIPADVSVNEGGQR